jgi:MFS family permease
MKVCWIAWSRMSGATDHAPSEPAAWRGARDVLRALPTGIWILGLGSMLMDASSESVHSLLPVFMAVVLRSSVVTIGVVEGIAEATAAITKLFSGALSDYLGRRKRLLVLGYALAAFTKPAFPLARSITWVLAARFIDRVGKGMRGAPRDALIADITPARLRGAAYGLRQALDSVGAVLGPLLVVAFMMWLADDIRAVMWVAVPPAFLAVALVGLGVRDPEPTASPDTDRVPATIVRLTHLPVHYWLVVLLGGVFTLARFSEAFLVLRAQDVGLALTYVPAVIIVMNVAYATFAFPAGAAADHLSRRALLLVGLALLIAADRVLAAATSALAVLVGAALWGLHMAATQGLLAKLVADTAPAQLRGTAFGVFNVVSGIALLLASVIAGVLWEWVGAPATFLAGAAFAMLAALVLLVWSRGTP